MAEDRTKRIVNAVLLLIGVGIVGVIFYGQIVAESFQTKPIIFALFLFGIFWGVTRFYLGEGLTTQSFITIGIAMGVLIALLIIFRGTLVPDNLQFTVQQFQSIIGGP